MSKNIFSFARWIQTFHIKEYEGNSYPTYSFGISLILATDWRL